MVVQLKWIYYWQHLDILALLLDFYFLKDEHNNGGTKKLEKMTYRILAITYIQFTPLPVYKCPTSIEKPL